jgi:signal peptidase I
MTTVILLLILLGLFVLDGLLWAGFLVVGLRVNKVEMNRMQVVKSACVMGALGVCYFFAVNGVVFSDPDQLNSLLLGALLFVAAPLGLVMFLSGSGFARALWSCLPTVFGKLILGVLFYCVIWPYLFGTFRAGNFTMAPTLVAEHVQKRCDVCGEVSFGRQFLGEFRGPDTGTFTCKNFHVSEVNNQGKRQRADSFFVAKFAKVKRWDIVAFDGGPEFGKSILRVVGLPGEKIEIVDGVVWADGKAVELPETLQGIRYNSGPELPAKGARQFGRSKPNDQFWGSQANPAQLGPEDFYLLADNSSASVDSRNRMQLLKLPNAIHESELIGVVTTVYLPIGRWKAFR